MNHQKQALELYKLAIDPPGYDVTSSFPGPTVSTTFEWRDEGGRGRSPSRCRWSTDQFSNTKRVALFGVKRFQNIHTPPLNLFFLSLVKSNQIKSASKQEMADRVSPTNLPIYQSLTCPALPCSPILLSHFLPSHNAVAHAEETEAMLEVVQQVEAQINQEEAEGMELQEEQEEQAIQQTRRRRKPSWI